MVGSIILAIGSQSIVILLVRIYTDMDETLQLIGSMASVAVIPVFWIYMSKKLQVVLWKCLEF